MYRTTASFDYVAVIESLPSGHLRSGTELFESRIAPASVQDPGLLSELYEPKGRTDFFRVLEDVKRVTEKFGRAPILQIETHGSPSGISLADGGRITWLELAAPLADLNRACQMNLFVFAGLCHGWRMIDLLRPTARAPVFALVGPTKEVPAGRLLSATQLLYENLLEPGHDLRAALDVANGSDQVQDWEFRWMSAELMFCHAFQSYVKEVSRNEVRSERLNRLVAQVARLQGLDVSQTAQLRSSIASDLDDHPAWFRRYRDHFLFLDLFPENKSRFPLTFDDCIKKPV